MKARRQTNGHTNQSLHYFNEYAVVKDRVAVPHLQNTRPKLDLNELEMSELLPTDVVQECIVSALTTIVPRLLVKYLHAYKVFQHVVVYHIVHQYSQESQKWLVELRILLNKLAKFLM